MRRKSLISLGVIVGLAALLLGLTLASDNEIILGIDLEGGAEVVLVPVDDSERSADELDRSLDQSVEIIRARVDGLGVAEPDITRQEDRIVVQMPGVEDQQQALEVVGQTAELRFRPVCALLIGDFQGPAEDGGGQGVDGLIEDPTSATSLGDLVADDPTFCNPVVQSVALNLPTSTREEDDVDAAVILPDKDDPNIRYYLGPTIVTGAGLESADAGSPNGADWSVNIIFRGGAEGIDLFNQAAAACYGQQINCSSGQLAAVLDGVVQSAPNVNAAAFQRDQIVVSGSFSRTEAEELALVLNFGALPLEFQDPTEQDSDSTVRQVSATLGRDSFDAGVAAGIVGLALVAAFMLLYYRLLGLAALLSLAISGTLLYVILAWLSSSQGLALTLAGVVGLIVSIGTSLDSNVVYFETLKEDISSGRTMRSSVDRSFPVAFKTIFYANLASLIGAAILYWLTIGSVRGFALMLGLASILDLIATYFFLRPLVQTMAHSQALQDKPGAFGLPPEIDRSEARSSKAKRKQDAVDESAGGIA